jgi:large subunit ribosomal protein L28
MANKCQISGVSRQSGHRVSHANNKRKHVFKANIQTKKIYLQDENRYVKIKVSTSVLRTIDAIGIKATLKKYNISTKDL